MCPARRRGGAARPPLATRELTAAMSGERSIARAACGGAVFEAGPSSGDAEAGAPRTKVEVLERARGGGLPQAEVALPAAKLTMTPVKAPRAPVSLGLPAVEAAGRAQERRGAAVEVVPPAVGGLLTPVEVGVLADKSSNCPAIPWVTGLRRRVASGAPASSGRAGAIAGRTVSGSSYQAVLLALSTALSRSLNQISRFASELR